MVEVGSVVQPLSVGTATGGLNRGAYLRVGRAAHREDRIDRVACRGCLAGDGQLWPARRQKRARVTVEETRHPGREGPLQLVNQVILNGTLTAGYGNGAPNLN